MQLGLLALLGKTLPLAINNDVLLCVTVLYTGAIPNENAGPKMLVIS